MAVAEERERLRVLFRIFGATQCRGRSLNGPLARRNSRYLIGTRLSGPEGFREDTLLALADPYLRSLAPARHPADDFEWVP